MGILFVDLENASQARGEGGVDLVPTMPICVCRKVTDMSPFSASSE